MKYRHIVPICLFILGYNISGSAQSPKLKINLITRDSDKPIGKINAICQDPAGFMWFCGQGEKCLFRYDGSQLVSYKHDLSDTNSLGGTNLETIYADDVGKIWIAHNNGVDEYNPSTNIFKHHRHDPNVPGSLCSNEVLTLLKDRKGRLWIGTKNGLDCFDEQTQQFIHYKKSPGNINSLSCNYISKIYEDRQGIIWVGTGAPWDGLDDEEGGLNRLEQNGSFTQFKHDSKIIHSLTTNKVRAIFEDSRGVFWVGTSGDGLHTMDRKTGLFERLSFNPKSPDYLVGLPMNTLPIDHIAFIQEDRLGTIWIGKWSSGIIRYDPILKTITPFVGNSSFSDSTSWTAFQSREGLLWISTEKNNLFKIDIFNKPLSLIPATDQVYSFVEDEWSHLWAGTYDGGLVHYDQQYVKLHQYKNIPTDSFSLFDTRNRVFALMEINKNILGLGTFTGAGSFNTLTHEFLKFKENPNYNPIGIKNKPVLQMIQDKEGIIWMSIVDEGLVKYDLKSQSYRVVIQATKSSPSINMSSAPYALILDKSGNVWAGGLDGINCVDIKENRIKSYLEKSTVSALLEDSKGNIWAGTYNGPYLYDSSKDKFLSVCDPNSPLNGFNIIGLTEDNAHNIWLHSRSNIIKLNPADMSSVIYDSKYGIDYNSLYPGAYKDSRGRILVGHLGGFISFDPEELMDPIESKVFITEMSINSIPVHFGKSSPVDQPINQIQKMVLNHDQNNVSFSFAMDDYRDGAKFYTKLEHYETEWTERKSERISNYFHIPPGKYIFKIKVFNADGVKSEKSIDILILKPWWRRWWAYLLYLFIFAFFLSMIYTSQKRRIIQAEKQKALSKEIEQSKEIAKAYHELKLTQDQLIQSEKMASLGELTSGIAHEIKNPLNFINNFSEINLELLTELEEENLDINIKETIEINKHVFRNLIKNSEKINHHGKRVDGIVKGMLQHSRLGNVTKESIDINSLCEESMKLAYHGYRSKERSFNAFYETRLAKDLPKVNCVPSDLGRVILNIINNSFYAVHQKQKKLQQENTDEKLEIESNYRPSVVLSSKLIKYDKTGAPAVTITISDNGMGIPQAIINKIFQPFFTTKPTGEGTGLGLSLSYDIISKVQGGEMKVKSKEGLGTDFEVIIPINRN